MSQKLQLKSPAKINLFFRVLSKRPDGYHEIASLYQAVDLYDHLTVSLSASDTVTCSNPDIPTDSRNLAHKALTLFRDTLAAPIHAQIDIDKHIPMGGGLGGGSSNAATVLYALNELTNRPFSLSKLKSMAAEIGSDVPFFFSSGSAYCTGRGEIMQEVPPPKLGLISLHLPGLTVSTPAVYAKCHPAAQSSIDPLQLLKTGAWVNDLEPPAMQVEPKLCAIKAALEKKYDRVVMSGSGSSFIHSGVGAHPIACIQRLKPAWY